VPDHRGQHGAAAQQIPEGAAFQSGQRRETHPGGMPGAGQGDIELAQILAQTLAIGPLQDLVIGAEPELQPTLRIVPFERKVVFLGLSMIGGERQKDQWVLESLGFVHRHHLHQIGVALETDLAGIAARAAVCIPALLGEMADQRMLAVEQDAGLLQQLGEMEQIGEDALPVEPRTRPFSTRMQAAGRGRRSR
jgi:hypothetical protein